MNSIKERPALFNGAMVRAIRQDRKTVTRRVMKVQPVLKGRLWSVYGAGWSDGMTCVPAVPGHSLAAKCPFGQPGDRLWVRETWYCDHFEVQQGPYLRPADMHDLDQSREDGELVYAADGLTPYEQEQPVWKPSIHMPRWASRILLEVTNVRVERLQDISDKEIEAEGIDLDALADGQDRYDMCHAGSGADGRPTLRTAWRDLWESTGGDWDANPWVWCVSFKRVTP